LTSNQKRAPAPARTTATAATETPAFNPAEECAAVEILLGKAVALEDGEEEWLSVGDDGFGGGVLELEGRTGVVDEDGKLLDGCVDAVLDGCVI
jgi:hypothetical protein